MTCTLLAQAKEIKVPFEFFDNRILVQVEVNDQGPFTFIFDTGGSNIMTPEVAQKLNLSMTAHKKINGAGSNSVDSSKVKIESMKLGRFQLKSQDFLTIDLNPIRKAFQFKQLDGIIGYEVLMQKVVTINYLEKSLTLTDAQNSKNGIGFDFEDEKPVIPATIDGKQARILIDTGDRSAMTLFKQYASTTGLNKKFADANEQITGYGVGGPIPAKLKTLDLILNNQIFLPGVLARFPTLKKGVFATSKLSASIGNEVLRRFTVTFDYKNKTIQLIPNQNLKEPYIFVPVKSL